MKVSILQIAARMGDRSANFERAARAMDNAMDGQPDVLVLPELWDLGFYPPDAAALADVDGAQARAFLSERARAYGVNIVGGSIVRSHEGKLFNTAYVFDRQGGQVSAYDKIHLFTLAGEEKLFSSGNSLAVYELDGVKAGSIICYDIRFCELARALALKDIEVLFVPAAWSHPRLEIWRTLVRARAIENQMYVVAANAAGEDSGTGICGHSMVVDPLGNIVAEAGEREQSLFGECDPAMTAEVRRSVNVFRDRRPELYSEF